MKKYYNKLVRDKIPELIAAEGKKVVFESIKNEEQFKVLLEEKLLEEVEELKTACLTYDSESIASEIADIEEILQEISDLYNIRYYDFIEIFSNKRLMAGRFAKRIFLESVEEGEEDD